MRQGTTGGFSSNRTQYLGLEKNLNTVFKGDMCWGRHIHASVSPPAQEPLQVLHGILRSSRVRAWKRLNPMISKIPKQTHFSAWDNSHTLFPSVYVSLAQCFSYDQAYPVSRTLQMLYLKCSFHGPTLVTLNLNLQGWGILNKYLSCQLMPTKVFGSFAIISTEPRELFYPGAFIYDCPSEWLGLGGKTTTTMQEQSDEPR